MVLSVRGVHLSLSRWSCLLLEQCCERMSWHAAYLPSGARPEITIQCYTVITCLGMLVTCPAARGQRVLLSS